MNGPAIYLERDASGQALLGVHLVGDSDHEHWSPEPGSDPALAPIEAAAWIRERLSGTARLGLICLDTRGSVCSWLDAPGGEMSVVRAAARQAPPGMWGDWSAMGEGEAGIDWRAASVQSVTEPAAPAPRMRLRKEEPEQQAARRSAVIAISDLPVRLLLDELDRRGVAVERIAGLWHAMAAAWDPGAPDHGDGASSDGSDVLTTRDTSDAAVVLIEADGKLVWSWSGQGLLIAAGTSRLDASCLRGDETSAGSAAGRLAADWLAWTAQLGRSPSRIVCLVDEDLGDGVAAMGRAFGGVWPGASLDLFRVPDPVNATLHRLRETTAGGKPRRTIGDGNGISDLASRPGRSHKSMYRWAAVALVAASIAFIGLGRSLRASAKEAQQEVATLTGGQRDRVREALPPGTDLTYPTLAAMTERDRLLAARPSTEDVRPIMPVLEGAEQIGFVVSSTGVRLERLLLTQSLVSVLVSGPDTASVEIVPSALRGGTGVFRWTQTSNITKSGDRSQSSIDGTWSISGDQEPSS